jgi:hypothetical protein
MASKWTQNKKKTEEESKCGEFSQARGGEAGNDERPAKRAKAASKKPPAAAKPKAAPKAAPKEASTKPTASGAAKQIIKRANEQERKAGAPRSRPSQGAMQMKRRNTQCPPRPNFSCAFLFPANRKKTRAVLSVRCRSRV